MKRNIIFDTVLKHNKDYKEAVENNASAEVQQNLLTQCSIIHRTMVIDAGLANEYHDYCQKLRLLGDKIFNERKQKGEAK